MNQSLSIFSCLIHFAVAAQHKYKEVWQIVLKLRGEILRRGVM